MEYDKELIDEIMGNVASATYDTDVALDIHLVRLSLESFLPDPLPTCPICGSEVIIETDDEEENLHYWVCCSESSVDFDVDWARTEQEARDNYLATPYCKLYNGQ